MKLLSTHRHIILKYLATTLFSMVLSRGGIAQDLKVHVLNIDTFIGQVKKNHPVAKQAAIQVSKASADLLTAKGTFDPAIGLKASRKTFDNKNYYYYTNPELAIPLPVGSIKAGIENNGGAYISPEASKGTTSYIGIEIPLAKGLLLDKRRAVLQQAKIFRNQSEQERLLQINNLLMEAYDNYWQWAGAYQLYNIYSKYTKAAATRFKLIRIAHSSGDRAAMDTLEALAQLQNYQLMQNDALLKLNNARLALSTYWWLNNDINGELPDNIVPDSNALTMYANYRKAEELIALSNAKNPTFKIYDFKLKALEVERKLKRQNLLPHFSIKANLLNKNYYAYNNLSPDIWQNNYQWGIDFKLPLFFRESLGEYKNVQYKIAETRLELLYKKQQTTNKIQSYHNEMLTISQQLITIQNMYNNYLALLKAEELRFMQGESSLFLINNRENKLLEIMQKQIELQIKYQKTAYTMQRAAGLLE